MLVAIITGSAEKIKWGPGIMISSFDKCLHTKMLVAIITGSAEKIKWKSRQKKKLPVLRQLSLLS